MLGLLCSSFVLPAQVGQEAGVGLYGGTSFLSHVRRGDDYKGRYTPDDSRAYYGGIGVYQPALSFLGIGLELGYQRNRFNYWYTTDRERTSVKTDMTYTSFLVTPSLTLNPRFLKGLFARMAVPIAFAAGSRGTYITTTFDFVNPPQSTEHAAEVEGYRRNLVGPEISLGYMYMWKNGTGIWVRGSTWRAATTWWKYSFTATPELPTLKRLSIELGFRIGTPGMRLFKAAYKPIDPTKPTLKQRLKDLPWNNQ